MRIAIPLRLYSVPALKIPLVTLCAVLLLGCGSSASRVLELGKHHFEQKEYDRAILELKSAVEMAPKNAEAHYQLGLAHLAVGDDGLAAGDLRWATELNPHNTDAQLKLAQILATTTDAVLLSDAETLARAVLQVRPGDADTLQTLGMAEYRRGSTKRAIEHFTEVLSRFPGHLKASLGLAAIRLEQRDAPAAERILKAAAATTPNSVDAQIALARFHSITANPAQAEDHLRRALELDPLNSPAMLDLARLQENQGEKKAVEQTLKRLSTLPEASYRSLHAVFLFETGNRQASITELEDLYKKDSQNREVRTRLIDEYLMMNRVDQAAQALVIALKSTPTDADALEQRCQIFINEGKLDEAERDLLLVLRSRPYSPRGHYLLAQVHHSRGRVSSYRKELLAAIQYDPRLLNVRLELSQSLRNEGVMKEALTTLDRMPEDQKSTLPAIIERNWVLLALGEIQLAQRGIEQGLKLKIIAPLLMQDGLIKLRQNQLEPGRAALEKALALAPRDTEILDAIATSFAIEKQPGRAIDRIRRHIAEHNSAPMNHLLGLWLERTADPAGARLAYAAAIKADPNFAPPHILAARLDLVNRRWDSARQLLAPVLAANPLNVEALLGEGMLEEDTGNYPAAVKIYRKILEIAPNNMAAMNNLSVRLCENPATVQEAMELAIKVQELAPENPAVNDTIGWAYYNKGVYKTALNYLLTAAANDKSARVRYHLAMAYFKLGDKTQGTATLLAAQKLDPSLPEAAMARKIAAVTP
jgi:tetratricopeptide (TPR) repeat protein